MCGFAGYLDISLHLDETTLAKMGDQIRHRGPDGSGTFSNENFALIHHRLKIIDLSESASQPMTSLNDRYVIGYNGEIYNFKELRRSLNLPDSIRSDTQVLLEGFSLKQEAILDELNGMFAFVIYDKLSKEIRLFRDRFGIKPLFYYWDGKNLVFGSEIKAIHSAIKQLEINMEAMSDFLFLEYIPADQTIFNKIKPVEPGTYVKIDTNGQFEIKTYYNFLEKTSTSAQHNSSNVLDEFESLLQSSIDYRSISDVPIGAFLSGGTDSSLICALYQKRSTQSIKSFNIGFHEAQFNESSFAKKAAHQLKTKHKSFLLDEEESFNYLDLIPKQYDQPFAVPGVIPMMKLSHETKKEVTVALSGDGADELFMGYGYYNWFNRLKRLQQTGGEPIISVASKGMNLLGPKYKRVSRLLNHKNLPNDWSHVWSQEQYMFTESEVESLTGGSYQHRSTTKFWKQLQSGKLSDMENISMFDVKYYLPDDLLYKVDIASMASGLEVRLPFLDHRLVEFCLSLTQDQKISNGVQKVLPKKLLSKFLSNDLVYRKKWGFPAPMNHWLKGKLSYLIDDHLNKDAIQKNGLLDHKTIEKMVNQFRSGQDWHYKRIWALINFQMWHNQYLK